MQQQYDPEQIFEELRNRFRGLRGWRIAAGILGAFLFILLWSTWFTVQPEETGIIQRFGAVQRTVGPGLTSSCLTASRGSARFPRPGSSRRNSGSGRLPRLPGSEPNMR